MSLTDVGILIFAAIFLLFVVNFIVDRFVMK